MTNSKVLETTVIGLALALTLGGLLVVPFDWRALLPHSGFAILMAALSLAMGAILGRCCQRRSLLAAVVFAVLASVLLWNGPGVLLALLACVAGAIALGSLIAGPSRGGIESTEDAGWIVASWVAGAGLLAGLMGWLFPLPIHGAAIWMVGIGLLVLLRRRQMMQSVSVVAEIVSAEFSKIPRYIGWVWGLAFLLATTAVLMPLRNSDDLRYHMIAGNELLAYGHGQLDVGAQSWALSPWSGDMLHALSSLLAGHATYAPLNIAWLGSAALLLILLARQLGATALFSVLASALFLSVPMTGFLAGSLQTELPTIAALLALMLALTRSSEMTGGYNSRHLWVVAVLAGLMVGLKISNLAYLAPVFILLVLTWRPLPLLRDVVVSTVLFVAAGLSSYAYAWLLTGNPVLPLYNSIFKSSWYAHVNFSDAQWHGGVDWSWPWDVMFETANFFDGTLDGMAGAVGICLLLVIASAAIMIRTKSAWPLLGVAVFSAVVLLHQTRYFRYVFPAVVLLMPVAALAISRMTAPKGRQGMAATAWVAIVCVQLLLWPAASWVFAVGGAKIFFRKGADEFQTRFVPEARVLQRFAATQGDRVLLTDPNRDYMALMPGVVMGRGWTAPLTEQDAAKETTQVGTWEAIFRRTGANYALAYDVASAPGLITFLEEQNAELVDSEGWVSLYRLEPSDISTQVHSVEHGVVISTSSPYPLIGRVDAVLHCGQAGDIAVTNWILTPSPPSTPASLHSWDTCGPGQRVPVSALIQTGVAGSGRIELQSQPRTPEQAPIQVEITRIEFRRDFSSDTALARYIYDKNCGLGCNMPRATLERLTNVAGVADPRALSPDTVDDAMQQ